MKLSINNSSIFALLLLINIHCNIGNVINYSLSNERVSGDNEIGNEIDITTKKTITTNSSSNLDTNKIEDNDHRDLEEEKKKEIKHKNLKMEKVCQKTIDKEHGYNYVLINATVVSAVSDYNNDIEAHLEFFLLWKSNQHTQRLCTEYWWDSQTNKEGCNIVECMWETGEYDSTENNL